MNLKRASSSEEPFLFETSGVKYLIYLDNAATTGKKPPSVIRAVDNALRTLSANPGRSGHEASLKAASAVYGVREKTARFFGASGAENVVFTLNCTHALNCVIKGVLRAGDHAVVSSLEHNAVMRPLVKTGVEYDAARVSLTDDNLTVREFERKLRGNTRLVVCTGASNVVGKILPIKRIGALCRERGIFFAVDAAQTAGVLPIDMKDMNIDYLCIAPHKGLYAPEGVGILICEAPIANTLIEGGTGTNSIELFQPDELPERLESGTVNVPGIIGISAGIDYVSRLGLSGIYSHELELCRYLYRFLDKLSQAELYTPMPEPGEYAPLVSFNIRGLSSSETAEYLNSRGIAVRAGLHCAPSAHSQLGTLERGTVRAAVASFNTQGEIQQLMSALKNLKKK